MIKTRVVQIITDTNIGGAGKVLQNYFAHHDKHKYDVLAVLPKESPLGDFLEGYGVSLIRFEKLSGKSMDFKTIIPMHGLLKRLKPDIVHTHASFSSRIAAKLYGKCKIIYTRHCAYPPSEFTKSPIGRLIGRIIAKLFADRVISISKAVKENLTETGVPEKMISVMMNGVDPLKELNAQKKASVRERYGILQTEKVAGMIGRLEPVKGHEFFIRAIKECNDNGLNIKGLIAGAGGSEKALKQLAGDIGISDRIIFTGFLDDVAPVVNILDVFVNASYGTEASSLAMLEAMSLGKPVVATNYGGNPYQVKPGRTGLLVPVKDADYLSDAIIRILNDDETYAEYSKNAKNEYNEHYTAEIMARNIEKVYKTTLSAG